MSNKIYFPEFFFLWTVNRIKFRQIFHGLPQRKYILMVWFSQLRFQFFLENKNLCKLCLSSLLTWIVRQQLALGSWCHRFPAPFPFFLWFLCNWTLIYGLMWPLPRSTRLVWWIPGLFDDLQRSFQLTVEREIASWNLTWKKKMSFYCKTFFVGIFSTILYSSG